MNIDRGGQNRNEYDVGFSNTVFDIYQRVTGWRVRNNITGVLRNPHLPGARGALGWRLECGYTMNRWSAGRTLFQPAGAGGLFIVVEQYRAVTTGGTIAGQIGGNRSFTATTFGVHDADFQHVEMSLFALGKFVGSGPRNSSRIAGYVQQIGWHVSCSGRGSV